MHFPDPIDFEDDEMEKNLKGFVNEDIELPCVVTGGPYYTIKWGKNNKTLSMNTNEPRSYGRNDELRYYGFEFDEKTKQPYKLILKGLQHFDRAEYYCNATSFDGNKITASFMLKVKGKLKGKVYSMGEKNMALI